MEGSDIKLHPEGEEGFEFQFSPSGGTHHLVASDDQLSAYGGVVAWDHFLKRTGLVEDLAEYYPLPRTSNNATQVADILKGVMLNFLLGGKRFAHIRRIQDDLAMAQIMGLSRGKLNGEDAFRRLCEKLGKKQLRQWMRVAEERIHRSTPQGWIADWDSTVISKYGDQEDVEMGYNPHKSVRKSLHPLVCVVAGTRLALHMRWRSGKTASSTDWVEAMEEIWTHPETQNKLSLNRGDIGFGNETVMAWHEVEGVKRPKYLFKLKLTSGVKKAIAKIQWPDWKHDAQTQYGIEQYSETTVKLSGWSAERRMVVTRILRPKNPTLQDHFWDMAEEEVHAYVTNLEPEIANPAQIVLCYRKRADSENVFDELKNQWGFAGFSSGKAVVGEASSRLMLLVYNLWSMFVRVVTDRDNHTEAITSRYELLMLPARIVKSGRKKTVKLSVGEKLKALLKAAYKRLHQWLSSTAPQLSLNRTQHEKWNLFLTENDPDLLLSSA